MCPSLFYSIYLFLSFFCLFICFTLSSFHYFYLSALMIIFASFTSNRYFSFLFISHLSRTFMRLGIQIQNHVNVLALSFLILKHHFSFTFRSQLNNIACSLFSIFTPVLFSFHFLPLSVLSCIWFAFPFSRLVIAGYLQHLLKLKTLDISKRMFDSVFRQGPPGRLLGSGDTEMPKDLSTAPAFPGGVGFPGLLAGFPPLGVTPNPSETEPSRTMTNPNDDKFYEDMISCSDEEDDMEDANSTNNNNEYDADMRQYEYASYKSLERSKRKEREEGSLRGLMGGIRIGGEAGGYLNLLNKGSDKFPRTNIEYRTELGELTIETGAGRSSSGRSRKHGGASLSVAPGASTAATSPRERSFIDKASVRQFCTQEGEHIFRCNICLKTYTHISNFCRHFLSAHDDRYKQEISCPVCFKMFTRRDNMMTHTKQVHRITLMRGTLQPVYLDGDNSAPTPATTTTATSTSWDLTIRLNLRPILRRFSWQ